MLKLLSPAANKWAALLAGLALLSHLPLTHAAERSPPPRAALAPVAGEVIVRFKADASLLRRHALSANTEATQVRDVLAQRASSLGARVGRVMQAGVAVGERMQVMRASGVDAQTLALQLAADPEVEFAVPNGRRRIQTAPNDPLYAATAPGVRPNGPDSGQWYLRKPTATVVSSIDIEAAWARTTGSASVVVAVLDTGVRFEHPDLGRLANGGRLLPGYDFVSNSEVGNDGDGRDADPSDPGDFTTAAENSNRSGTFYKCDPAGTGQAVASGSSWHGTATSSLVGAASNNGLGMAGTAPGVQVLPVRVLGKCFGNDADIQAGMLWAAGIRVDGVPDNPNPAKVLNMSLGGDGACTAAYQNVVNQVLAKGTVIVAAAGNSTGRAVGTPGNCPGVVAVLALRHAGSKVGFSDLGPEIAISAPGGNCINITAGSPCLYPILAASNSGGQGPVASVWTDSFDITVGTSFSSPLVAGVVGLMFSQQPALSPLQVRTALQNTARAFPTSGADNGPDDPSPVLACRPPSSVDQLQCYCNTAVCGAGMLDAGAAVAAVAGSITRIDSTPAAAVAGTLLSLSSAGSVPASGRSIVAWAWTLVDGGGVVTGFASATNAASASLTPTAAGSFTVRLVVTDSLGAAVGVNQTISVAAAPVVPPVVPPSNGGGGGGGGGGASSLPWVALLGLAVLALLHTAWRVRRFAR